MLRGDGKGHFGAPRIGGEHKGADLKAPLGSSVGAADIGKVVAVDNVGGSRAGKYVIIEHANAQGEAVSYTGYMHLSGVDVEEGDNVAAGEEIGQSGDTGNAKGEPEHLHFEIRYSRFGGRQDPMRYFDE